MSVPTAESPAATMSAPSSVWTPNPRPLPPLPARWTSLIRAFVEAARAQPGKVAMADSTKVSLTYGDTLLRAVVLSRVLKRILGPEPYVGLLIPPSVPTAVANIAVMLLGKIPVNLNYTASQALIDSSINQCGIKHVLTSPKLLEKFGITPKAELVFLEDLRDKVTTLDKVIGAAIAKLTPTSLLGAFLPGLKSDNLDDTATIIFTSGSTGDPKGVVLSHRNILSNIHQMNNHLDLLKEEVVLGILPFFHSFGFTVAIWTVLCLGKKVVYHINPLDAKIIGDLCEKHEITMIASTPTFVRSYIKRCPKEQFKWMKHLLVGAEKLKPELCEEIRQAIGKDPLEGYGTTELSPVVAVNVTYDLTLRDGRKVPGNRFGTVGMPLPATEVKTVDPETEADLPVGTTGLIWVRGPQVMVGYLNRPDATAKVLKDGWYNTGDLGYVDPDGFLRITDRLSRFSKIAGEMVPHMGVESAIQDALGLSEPCVAVTALPDPKRGERLFVLYSPEMTVSPSEVFSRLQASALPRLWVPAAEDFVPVEAIPILGTGKVDLRRLKELAAERGKR
jgi:acyl-[acyl-carrier-protein]-phospholipid O-acyltransferase / long-chain-fatty-acid--[acyl-carrier-protein] ligase